MEKELVCEDWSGCGMMSGYGPFTSSSYTATTEGRETALSELPYWDEKATRAALDRRKTTLSFRIQSNPLIELTDDGKRRVDDLEPLNVVVDEADGEHSATVQIQAHLDSILDPSGSPYRHSPWLG